MVYPPPQYPYPPQPGQAMAQGGQQVHPQVPPFRRPLWAQEFVTLYRGRIARQFVIHFNINDFVLNLSRQEEQEKNSRHLPLWDVVGVQTQPRVFREYLHDLLYEELNCQATYTYTLASGLLAEDRQHLGIGQPLATELGAQTSAGRFLRTAMESLGLQRRPAEQGQQGQQGQQGVRPPGQRVEGQEIDLPRSVPDHLKILGHLLRQQYYPDGISEQQAFQRSAPYPPVQAPIAVILDYAEKLTPFHVGEGQGTTEQLQALEVLQSWALDPVIRMTNNVIVLLTTNIGQLPASISAEGSGCRSIRVPLPNDDERLAYIRHKAQHPDNRYRLAALSPDFAKGQLADGPALQRILARSTQGMRLMDIDNLNRRIIMQCRQQNRLEVLTPLDVRSEKAEVIQSQSSQLLEIVPPERGFNEIGGLEKLKQFLRRRTALMLQGRHSPLIPSGLLLAGPPGTGKTIIAEALAFEGGFNLVKMRNIQDRWVGSSERNLDMVLGLLHDLHPVIVFIDEIDQAMGRRDSGQNGDSGVSARMFARILEEMSKASNRGRIMWVAATNRSDYLDDALLRRFDRVVPLLAPDGDESRRIFATMPDAIRKQSGNTLSITYGGDLQQSGHKIGDRMDPTREDLAKFTSVAERSAAMGLTGAEIEIVVRRAMELACEDAEDRGTLSDTDLPPITSQHLFAALADFKMNHNPDMYDLQSLLAIRSCNFYSTLPEHLPNRPIFEGIMGADGRLDPDRLDVAIRELALRVSQGLTAGASHYGSTGAASYRNGDGHSQPRGKNADAPVISTRWQS